MSIEGRLSIQIELIGDAVNAVTIDSSRPVHACRVFNGKAVSDALTMLPLLFNICGTAQASAGVRACEQAMGIAVSEQTEQLRNGLVGMETLREHLWRTLLDWPVFLGAAPESDGMAEMVAIHRDFSRAICSDATLFQPGGGSCLPDREAVGEVVKRLSTLLQRTLFGLSPEEWLDLTDAEALTHWARETETLPARLLAYIMDAGWSGAGDCEPAPLPELDKVLLDQQLEEDDFVAQPTWGGRCYETTAFTRIDSPLLNSLVASRGGGLMVRLVARLIEIAQLAVALKTGGGYLSEGGGMPLHHGNPGIGSASAARGQLYHRVAVEGGSISSYQILAPTEWNFHPRGVVAQALSSLKGNSQQIEQQARLLINAIDPCVGYELQVGES